MSSREVHIALSSAARNNAVVAISSGWMRVVIDCSASMHASLS
jgi:hypothetical protein